MNNNNSINLLTKLPIIYSQYTKIKLSFYQKKDLKSYQQFMTKLQNIIINLILELSNKIDEINLKTKDDAIYKLENQEKIKKYLINIRENNNDYKQLANLYNNVKNKNDIFLEITQFCAELDEKIVSTRKEQLWYLNGISVFSFDLKQQLSNFIYNLGYSEIFESFNELKISLNHTNILNLIFNSL